MSLPWATPGEKGCPCAVLSLTATAQYCVCRLCVCFCVVGQDCPRWLSLRVSPVGHPPLYMSIHNPVLSVPSVAVPDLFVDLSGLQQAFQLKQVEKFLETIVKKRGNIYLEWWAQWKALQGFSLWPAHSLKQLKLPVPRDAGSGWITGAVHTVVTASLPRAGLLECTSICSIQTCLLYGHFHMNWMEVQLLLWSAAIQQHSVLTCLSQACCKLGALSWFHKNANSSKSRNL